MGALKLCNLLLAVFFFSGLMQLSMAMAQDVQPRVVDAKFVDQAIAYLLMLVALFVTYLAH